MKILTNSDAACGTTFLIIKCLHRSKTNRYFYMSSQIRQPIDYKINGTWTESTDLIVQTFKNINIMT